jgi:hypothetical protein
MLTKIKYNLIKIEKEPFSLCSCCLTKKKSNWMNFPYFDQNCIFKVLTPYITKLQNDIKSYLLLHVSDINTNLFKLVHYAYHYRIQKNLPMPDPSLNIYNDCHFNIFLNFLVNEYIEESYNNVKHTNDSVRNIQNPIYVYNPRTCILGNDTNNIFRRIILLPGINLKSTY